MSVIERAEQRLQEENRQNDLGADNGHMLAYWSAYLDGARAQRTEDMKTRHDELNGAYRQGYDAAMMETKRGVWIQQGDVGWPEWKCSVCHGLGRGDYKRCPWCGAVMYETNASNASNALNALDNAQDGPIVTPCRGCSDYDGYGGCKSKGGCARAKMEVQDGSSR